MGIEAASKVKFAIIDEAIKRDENLLKVATLCEIAGVSRSGYYNWVNSAPQREMAEERDRRDFDLIKVAYQHRGYAKGARQLHMRLLHQKPSVLMNIKKIRRLMKKYGLRCPIRKANPYRRMAKALATSNVAPNLLNREFQKYGERKVLLTDITYLFFDGGKCYLSVILDAYTKQVLAFKLSQSLEVDFVLETFNELMEKHGKTLSKDTMVHSDQGCHYTSHRFIEIVKNSDIRQSMSRRANCWDNAPQESFFGHMKDEIDLSVCTTFEQVSAVIFDWIDYYNNERYKWDLAKLSPNEFYEYVSTGNYPLQGVSPPIAVSTEPERCF